MTTRVLPVNVLDILLLVAAVWFAIIGYRQGFVVGILSVIGFLGGGLVAVYLLPVIWDGVDRRAPRSPRRPPSSRSCVVIVCASVGQAFTTHLGNKLRRYITWSPARALDATGGALVNVVAMLLVAWLIGSALAGTTLPTLGKEVRDSKVLLGVSRVVPGRRPTPGSPTSPRSSRRTASRRSSARSPTSRSPTVQPPDPALAQQPGGHPAPSSSIVKVVGTAPSCGKVLEGTGFVFADRRVMTNAHVVGGVDEPDRADRRRGPAVRREGRALRLAARHRRTRRARAATRPRCSSPQDDASSGDDAIVAGFPENGAFDVRAARVRGRITANGPDIYHRGTVRRDVYSLYATVRQGNSGGPLLTPTGRVYGVVFAKSLDDADTGYALTADEIAPGHRAAGVPPTSRWTARAARCEPRVRCEPARTRTLMPVGAALSRAGWRSRAETQRARRRRMRGIPSRGSCARIGCGAAPLGDAQRGIGGSGGSAIACCVTVVVRPAHTPTSARAPRSVIAAGCANWPMRQAIGCS